MYKIEIQILIWLIWKKKILVYFLDIFWKNPKKLKIKIDNQYLLLNLMISIVYYAIGSLHYLPQSPDIIFHFFFVSSSLMMMEYS